MHGLAAWLQITDRCLMINFGSSADPAIGLMGDRAQE